MPHAHAQTERWRDMPIPVYLPYYCWGGCIIIIIHPFENSLHCDLNIEHLILTDQDVVSDHLRPLNHQATTLQSNIKLKKTETGQDSHSNLLLEDLVPEEDGLVDELEEICTTRTVNAGVQVAQLGERVNRLGHRFRQKRRLDLGTVQQ